MRLNPKLNPSRLLLGCAPASAPASSTAALVACFAMATSSPPALHGAPETYASVAPVSDEVVRLDPFGVHGDRPDDYTPPTTALAGKDTIPLLENPQSISIITEAQLADWRPLKLEDALAGVAGIATGGYYDDWDYLRIRGFDVTPNETYLDGLRSGAAYVAMNIETFGLERIEVLKGPAGLYGAGSAGGLVNLVSKRPRPEAFAKVELTAGSHDFIEGTFDFNQPLAGDDLLFRFVALGRDRNSHIDHVGSRRLHLAPSLTWHIGPATTLTLLGSYHENEGRLAWPLPAEGTVLPNPNGPIPTDLYNGEPDSNWTTEHTKKAGFELTHAFTEQLTLTQSFRYEDYANYGYHFLYPAALSDDKRTLYRYWWDWDEMADAVISDTRLSATLGREDLEHHLTAGVDYFHRDHHADYGYNASDLLPLDLYEPDYGAITYPEAEEVYGSDFETRITGLYAQDHVDLGHGVTVTVGGRYDFTEVDGVREEAFTGRAGATWEFVPGLTAYANYSEAFNPQSGTTVAGDPLDPETGDSIEAGLRSRLLDGRLSTTLALYEVTRANLANADLANPGYSFTTGEQRSRGVELDARFTPVKGWEILGAYAYTDTEITSDNTKPVGARLANVPLHSLNVWSKYTLQSGLLEGVGFGLGAGYTGARPGDLTYTRSFELPAYTLWRAALYYTRGPFQAQLQVTNLFDREHYVGAYDALYVGPGAPRTARLTVGWTF